MARRRFIAEVELSYEPEDAIIITIRPLKVPELERYALRILPSLVHAADDFGVAMEAMVWIKPNLASALGLKVEVD